MGKKAAGSPAVPGASITFLAGTRGASVKDGFLDQAAKWVAALVANAGSGALSGKLGDPGTVATTLDAKSKLAAAGTLDTATLDGKLGGLRGHTLVFVTHGLDVDKSLPKKEQEDTEGLLFHNMTSGGRTDSDIVLIKAHLDRMKVDGGKVVPDVAGLDLTDAETKKFVGQVTKFARVMDAVRRGVWQHVYFAACGTAGRLGKFAKRFQELANVTVFFNDEAIFFPDGGAIFAEVGVLGADKKSVILSDGLPYFAAAGAAKVKLKSGTDTFLPGSMERAP